MFFRGNLFLAIAFDERGFFMVNKGLKLALIEASLD